MGMEWSSWQDLLIEFGVVFALCVPVFWLALRRTRQLDRRRQQRQHHK